MDTLPVPGMLVGSNVRLMRLLGSGGMGSIWVAEHLLLQMDVAVKFLAPELVRVPEARARFEREAAAAAQLKSRHVVQIFDRGVTEQGLPYIVMELLVGEDLGKHIERLGPRPLSEVVAVVTQVARALHTAHAQGIVHRDIKPENVFMVDGDGGRDTFAKLLDFGIAKRAQDSAMNVTSTNIMMGTPHFMSPEQLMSPKDVDFRADAWSVAVVAYVALTGMPPFDGATIGALCVAVNSGDFQPVTRSRRDLPASIDGWFERAFQRDPSHRFGSIQEMASALERAAGNSLHQSLAPGGVEIIPRQVPSDGPSVAVHPTGPRATPFEASITHGQPARKGQFLTVMAVVGLSVISSATTTLVVLGPASFEVVGAVARIAFDKPERPSTHSSLAAVPPVSASALRETPLVEPVISPAGSSDGDTVEIQANRPESTTRKFVGGASPGAPGFRADGVASKNTPAQPVLPVPNAATPSDEASSAEASNPGGSPDHQNDDGTSAGDDGPDYGF